jgi:hypothetical protein
MILQKTKNERVSDSPSDLYAIILAQVVCFINALGGYLIARKAFMKPFEKFVFLVGTFHDEYASIGIFSVFGDWSICVSLCRNHVFPCAIRQNQDKRKRAKHIKNTINAIIYHQS